MRAIIFILVLIISACSMLQVSPEQQIREGANALTVGVTITGTLAKLEKITKEQTISYRALMATVSNHLDTAYVRLAECRRSTGSDHVTVPDPCRALVQDDIALAIKLAGAINNTLHTQEIQ